MTAKLIKFETPRMVLARISRENRRQWVESSNKVLTEKQRQMHKNRVLIEAMMADALFSQELEEFERLVKLIENMSA